MIEKLITFAQVRAAACRWLVSGPPALDLFECAAATFARSLQCNSLIGSFLTYTAYFHAVLNL